jgi:hypothetical protein
MTVSMSAKYAPILMMNKIQYSYLPWKDVLCPLSNFHDLMATGLPLVRRMLGWLLQKMNPRKYHILELFLQTPLTSVH